MKLHDLLTEANHEYDKYPDDYVPNFRMSGMDDFKVGAVVKPTTKDVSAEEAKAIRDAGVDPMSMPSIPIVYGYEMSWDFKPRYGTSTRPEMDMLKDRGPHKGKFDTLVKPHLDKGMNYFVSRMFDKNMLATSNKQRASEGVNKAVKLITNPNTPKVIIPLPSSSRLVTDIATQLNTLLSSKGIQTTLITPLYKKVPEIAHETAKALGLQPQVFTNASDFQIKNMLQNAQSQNGKLYYNWIGVKDLSVPAGAEIILVDDNVASGQTMMDAAKSIYRKLGKIVPIVGCVLHKFTGMSDQERDAAQRDWDATKSPEQLAAEKAERIEAQKNKKPSTPKQSTQKSNLRDSQTLQDAIISGLIFMPDWHRFLEPVPTARDKQLNNEVAREFNRKLSLKKHTIGQLKNMNKWPTGVRAIGMVPPEERAQYTNESASFIQFLMNE